MFGGRGAERVQYLPPPQFDPLAVVREVQVSRNVDPKKALAPPFTHGGGTKCCNFYCTLSYLGIFLIKLLTKPPEVGKAMANP